VTADDVKRRAALVAKARAIGIFSLAMGTVHTPEQASCFVDTKPQSPKG